MLSQAVLTPPTVSLPKRRISPGSMRRFGSSPPRLRVCESATTTEA